MASFYLSPFASFLQVLTDAGQVQPGLLIWTYAAGTVTPSATWTDITGSVPNSNPIQLNAAGRLNNVSIWQQGGVPLKFQFSTNAGTVLAPVFGQQIGPTFDQVSGIDDPAGLLATLAATPSGSGVDLVANAIKSYDLFATVRAAAVPNPVAGQNVIIDVLGNLVVNDGGGGFFYWSASSTAADDATNVIKPTAAGATGRYLRQNPLGVTGSVTVTLNGVTGTVTAVAQYFVFGSIVTFRVPQISGTSNSTSMTLTFSVNGLLASIAPFQAQNITVSATQDNGAAVYNQIATVAPAVLGNMTIAFYKNGSATGWTNTGTKGISDGSGAQYSVPLMWVKN